TNGISSILAIYFVLGLSGCEISSYALYRAGERMETASPGGVGRVSWRAPHMSSDSAEVGFDTDDPVVAGISEVCARLRSGELQEAGAAVERLLQTWPIDARVHVVASALHIKMGETPEAFEQLAVALGLDPGNPDIFRRLGVLLKRCGRPAEGEQVLEV